MDDSTIDSAAPQSVAADDFGADGFGAVRYRLRTALLARHGDSEGCEDALAPAGPIDDAPLLAPLRLAVADGAGSSWDSGDWARRLVHAFVDGVLDTDTPDISGIADAWRADHRGDALPWYAVDKARGGAHAALACLTVHPDGAWDACGVGDCCVFQIRTDALLHASPIDNPDTFSSTPALLSTIDPNASSWWRVSGSWRAGDDFYLLSDALAQWFLGAASRGHAPWRWLRDVETDRERRTFTKLRDDLWTAGALRRDDLAALVLTLRGMRSLDRGSIGGCRSHR